MAEYIEREATIEAIDNSLKRVFVHKVGKSIIDKIPAADVRPVVTCGECKHWFENGSDYCSCDRDALLRERDFFCAAGEKREET